MSIPPNNTATLQHSLQHSDEAGGEPVSIPPCNTATLQHPENGRVLETIRGVLVDYDAYSDLLYEGLGIEKALELARIDHETA